MTNAFMTGTIKGVNTVELFEGKKLYIVEVKEHDSLSFIFESDRYPRYRSRLKKGSKFLFEGYLAYFSPELVIHEVLAGTSLIKPQKITGKGKNGGALVAVNGRITEAGFFRTKRKKHEMARARFHDIPGLPVFIFPDMCEKFYKEYKKKKDVTVIGELVAEKPRFFIEKAKKIG